MITMKLTAVDTEDLHNQLRAILHGVPLFNAGIGTLSSVPDLERFEAGRQTGFRQGFERGLCEGKAGDVAQQQLFAEVDDGAMAVQAEVNRQVAAEAAEKRAKHYGSVSDPAMVAEALKQQHHRLPGE